MEIYTLHSHKFSLHPQRPPLRSTWETDQSLKLQENNHRRSEFIEAWKKIEDIFLRATIITSFMGIKLIKTRNTPFLKPSNKSYKPIINYSQINEYPVLLEHTHSSSTAQTQLSHTHIHTECASALSVWLILPGLMRNITLPHILWAVTAGWNLGWRTSEKLNPELHKLYFTYLLLSMSSSSSSSRNQHSLTALIFLKD